MSHSRYGIEKTATFFPDPGRLLYVTEAINGPDWHSYIHSHPFAELFFVRSGRGFFHINDSRFPVNEDDLILVNADIPHTEMVESGHSLSYLVIGIENVSFDLREDSRNSDGYVRFNLHGEADSFRRSFSEMLNEMRSSAPFCEACCQELYRLLAVRLTRLGLGIQALEHNTVSRRDIGLIRKFIDNHYSENLSLDRLAEMTHMNKYHMAHRFSKSYGVSPIRYLSRVRIREAERLLRESDYSIAEVATLVGFSSLSYFSQSFKAINGYSAGQYRKQLNTSTSATTSADPPDLNGTESQ